MSDYEEIKRICLHKNILWEDPEFRAIQSSVFYHQTPPFQFEWKRSKEIYMNPTFMHQGNEVFDLTHGELGDKWMLSCLGVLYVTQGLFDRVVPPNQTVETSYAGVFRFRLWWFGQWREVLVDDRLPTVNGRLVFMQSIHSEQMWPALLEKAFAKLHGSYEALKYGSVLDGLAELTGGVPDTISMEELGSEIMLNELIQFTSLITARLTVPIKMGCRSEIKAGLNYLVTNVEMVASTKGPLPMVRVCRQLSFIELHTPQFLLISNIWHMILPHERSRITSSKGIWMLFEDFVRTFEFLEVVHLDGETQRVEQFFANKYQWQIQMYQSGWKRGITAGGCRNYSKFFHTNPQIQIELNEEANVVISLNQHKIINPKIIGISIYKMETPATEIVKRDFFKKYKSAVDTQYTNSRQVTHRLLLPAGTYLIIPTTYEPRKEADFTLRIFSYKTFIMKVLDNIPQMTRMVFVKAPRVISSVSFEQYETMFLQLADELRTIDSYELKELLDACLPNDFIKSCASPETCKQIVLTLDKKGSGRISLTEFKNLICTLKHWQLMFRLHATERMGVIHAERFRDALRDVGFVIPEKVLVLLLMRYMRNDAMLRFGDFVSAIMHLHRAFEMFEKSNGRSVNPQISLAEWLKDVLMC